MITPRLCRHQAMYMTDRKLQSALVLRVKSVLALLLAENPHPYRLSCYYQYSCLVGNTSSEVAHRQLLLGIHSQPHRHDAGHHRDQGLARC